MVEAGEPLRLLAVALDLVSDAVLVTEAAPLGGHGPRIVLVNRAFTRLTGYRAEEVVGRSARLLQGPATDRWALARLAAALRVGVGARTRLVSYRRDGSAQTIEIEVAPLRDDAGCTTHWVVVQRRVAEPGDAGPVVQAPAPGAVVAAAADGVDGVDGVAGADGVGAVLGAAVPGPRARAMVAAVLSALPCPAVLLDQGGVVVQVNRAWQEFGARNGGDPRTAGVGADYLAVCRVTTGPRRREAVAVARGIEQVIAGRRQSFVMDYECAAPTQPGWSQVNVVPVPVLPVPGGPPRTGRVVVSHVDVTARRQGEAALLHQASHDALTGLPNRARLASGLREQLERVDRHEPRICVLSCGLDGFRRINETLGHDQGDRLLQVVADRLRSLVEPGDLLARTGGDQFVVVRPGADVTGARRLAERIASAVREAVPLDGVPLSLTASVGIATTTSGASDAATLLRDADAAMYEAKESGRARAAVFEGELRARVDRRLRVDAGLRRSLAHGGLSLHRQPIVDLVSGEEQGGEALLRWRSEDGVLHGPDDFLDVAVQGRLMPELTRYVLTTATRTVADAPGARIAVNVSPVELHAPGFVAQVRVALAAAGVGGEALTLEVTEQSLLDDRDALRRLVALRGLGVRVSLDDFGTGYSSMSHVARLPIDELKIDRSFTSALDGRASRAVVSAVVGMARDLSLAVVAEGVETRLQRQVLLELGVAYGQGWLLGRPEPWSSVGSGDF